MLVPPFRETGVPGREAVVAILDLQGFSHFLTQPDVHLHAPAYLNHVFSSVQELFRRGRPSWVPPEFAPDDDPFWIPEPTFAKFMGDGALYIWTAPTDQEAMDAHTRLGIVSRLWVFRSMFDEILRPSSHNFPLVDAPQTIRIGITRGTVYGLCHPNTSTPIDYIGHCVNLAARLQSYCRDLGFIASARVAIDPVAAAEKGLRRVVAKQLRGLNREIVYVEESEFAALREEVRSDLFEEESQRLPIGG